jgi:selenophosphate synthetase-related protein
MPMPSHERYFPGTNQEFQILDKQPSAVCTRVGNERHIVNFCAAQRKDHVVNAQDTNARSERGKKQMQMKWRGKTMKQRDVVEKRTYEALQNIEMRKDVFRTYG